MSNMPAEPPENEKPTQDELKEERSKKLNAFLQEKWGDPAPPCPYCRITDWRVDTEPLVIQKWATRAGFGVPVFPVWCGNCGHEVLISVAVADLWDNVGLIEYSEPPLEDDAPAGS